MSGFSILGFFTMVGNIFAILGDLLKIIITYFLVSPLFLVFVGILILAHFGELIFKKMAGIDVAYLNGQEYGGASDGTGQDLVYAFITEPAVQNVFWSIVGLSIVLLFIFTIVALIKSEFALDLKGSAKGPIIGRALKSLANFIIVPVTALISVVGVNFLTKTIYDLFGGDTASVVSKCFYVGAYNANWARQEPEFAKQLAKNEYWSGQTIFEGTNPFEGMEPDEVAVRIDDMFLNSEAVDFTYADYNLWDELCKSTWNGEFINFGLIFTGIPNDSVCNYLEMTSVAFYYNLADFDWILCIGSALAITWILLSVSMVLVKRIFELTILFLLAPPMIAIAPLDGGSAEKKWRQEFMKRLLAVIAPVFAFNMYFLLVPLFSGITLFPIQNLSINPTLLTGNNMMGVPILVILATFIVLFNIMFQIICVIVGMSIVKSASAMLSNMLGIEDLVKSGDEAGKKAIKTGASAFKGAAALAIPAVKGAAIAMKGLKAAKTAGKFAKNNKDMLASKEDVSQAKDDVKSNEDAVTAAKENQANFDKENNVDLARDRLKQAQERGEAGDKKDLDLVRQSDQLKNDTKIAEKKLEDSRSTLAKREMGISKTAEDKIAGLRDKKGKTEDQIKKDAEEADKLESDIKTANVGTSWKAQKKALREAEFGKDAENTSMFASMFDDKSKFSKTMKWMESHGLYGAANKEMLKAMFNPKDASQYDRRRNDFMTEIMGDKGDLNKIFFNKNSRASELVEGVPEAKQRSAAIEQGLSWTAKGNVDKDLADKKARKEQEDILRRMLAEEKKDTYQMQQFLELMKQKDETNPNDYARIQELNAQIETIAAQSGLAKEARDYYDDMKKGDESKARRFSDYDKKMQLDADDRDAKADAAKAKRINDAAERNGLGVQQKIGNMSPEELIGAIKNIINELQNNPLTMKMQEGKTIKTEIQQGKQDTLKIDATQLKEAIAQLQEAFSGESPLVKSISDLVTKLGGTAPSDNSGN